MRPRPGSTTEKSPPASFSIAAVNAPHGPRNAEDGEDARPDQNQRDQHAGDERGPRDGRGLSFGFGAGFGTLLLGKVDDLVGQLRISSLIGASISLRMRSTSAIELCERRCGFAALLHPQGDLLLADRFDLLLPLAEIADQHDQAAAPLALGIDGVERERGFSRAGQSGEDHELVARNLDVDVLEIVFACAAYRNRAH